jgi:putative heme-binding domain-containing protein
LKCLESDIPPEVRDKIFDNLKLFLPGKWRDLRGSAELTEAIKKMLTQLQTRATGLTLIGLAEKTDLLSTVIEAAGDPKEVQPVRKAAIRTLGTLPAPDAAVALANLLDTEPAVLRAEVIEALGSASEQKANQRGAATATKTLQDLIKNKNADKDLRLCGLAALASTRPGTDWLLGLGTRGELPEELKADTGRLLRNSAFQDLRNKANIVFAPNRLDPKKLPDIAVLAKRKGDVAHGKVLMTASSKNDMQCMKCHTIRGTGGQVGPDLSMIGKKASRENLFESILYPSKAIADQYIMWVIETKKGVQYSGLLIEDTPEAVTLRDGNGKDVKIDAKQIDTRTKSPKSIMPEDLLAYMTEDQLVDMVEYLFTLKTPALAFDAFHIVGPFDNGVNDAGLDEAFPPETEKVPDLKATYAGKSGKVGWRTVKPDGGGYFDLQAFYAPDSTNIVSYLYRDIDSPADQDATILLGADDGCKLWINDKVVHTNRQHLAAVPERETVKIKLQKGKNRLLFKINNGNNPHGFYMTILSEQELKLLPLK